MSTDGAPPVDDAGGMHTVMFDLLNLRGAASLDNEPIEFFTYARSDGKTSVETRYKRDVETCLRPTLAGTLVFDDAAEAVATAMIMDNQTAFIFYASQGQPFFDRLVAQIREKNVTSYPCSVLG